MQNLPNYVLYPEFKVLWLFSDAFTTDKMVLCTDFMQFVCLINDVRLKQVWTLWICSLVLSSTWYALLKYGFYD